MTKRFCASGAAAKSTNAANAHRYLIENRARQQNLWVDLGSGKAPSV